LKKVENMVRKTRKNMHGGAFELVQGQRYKVFRPNSEETYIIKGTYDETFESSGSRIVKFSQVTRPDGSTSDSMPIQEIYFTEGIIKADPIVEGGRRRKNRKATRKNKRKASRK
jgi:hypothetical protein